MATELNASYFSKNIYINNNEKIIKNIINITLKFNLNALSISPSFFDIPKLNV